MKIGSRWLFAALAGTILAAPGGPALAQAGTPAAPGDATTTAPTVETRPGQQLFYQKPLPIRPGQPISVLAFPFGYGGEEEAAPTAAPAEAPAPGEGAATATPTVAPKSLLTQDQQDLLNYATAAVKAGFLSSPLYAMVTYHPQSSLVQRAVSQEVLRKEQLLNVISLKTGATNVDRAKVIAEHLSMQTLLVGTADVKSDVKANSTEVTLTVQLIQSTSGEVLRTAAASGAAQGAEGVPMLQVEQRAALDAAQKLLPAMGIELVKLPAPPAEVAPANGKAKSAPKSKEKKEKKARVVPASAPEEAAAPAPAPAPEEAAAPAPSRETATANRESEKQAREATRAARRQADAARKASKEAEEEAAKQAKKEAEQARKAERNASRRQARNVTAPTEAQADQQPAAAPEGQVAPAARSSTGVTIPSATGTSSYESGLPVPYGYAIGESKTIAPPRNKSGLKVPAWLGVAGFLTGISFLL